MTSGRNDSILCGLWSFDCLILILSLNTVQHNVAKNRYVCSNMHIY